MITVQNNERKLSNKCNLQKADFLSNDTYIGSLRDGWYRSVGFTNSENWAYILIHTFGGQRRVIGVTSYGELVVVAPSYISASWFDDAWEYCPNQNVTITF